jgi:hypothetical protein
VDRLGPKVFPKRASSPFFLPTTLFLCSGKAFLYDKQAFMLCNLHHPSGVVEIEFGSPISGTGAYRNLVLYHVCRIVCQNQTAPIAATREGMPGINTLESSFILSIVDFYPFWSTG